MRSTFSTNWRRIHHIANGECRKFHGWLLLCVDGEEDTPSPSASARITKYLSGDELTGGDEPYQVFRRTAEPRGKQHGVGFFGVEFSERPVADAAIVNDFAAFQPEIAEFSELQFLGAYRKSKQARG
jgi:hypothetical protein